MLMSPDHRTFFVVVPIFNEERGLRVTLDSLAAQSDCEFTLVLVDNESTDGSTAIARAFAHEWPALAVHLLSESWKGTGAAADTGFRFAIAHGAQWIARTDADCLPDRHWVRNLKGALADDGLEFVAGVIRPREDESALALWDRLVLRGMIWIAERYGRFSRRGARFKYPYFMAAGNNLAISAALYVRSGGFPRRAIEEVHEDRALSESVRTLTTRAARRTDVIVYNSVRRVRAYGYLNTLRWYRNHGYRGAIVDVR
jgi:glycosyltransferase involved in cell wall biosynthesis